MGQTNRMVMVIGLFGVGRDNVEVKKTRRVDLHGVVFRAIYRARNSEERIEDPRLLQGIEQRSGGKWKPK